MRIHCLAETETSTQKSLSRLLVNKKPPPVAAQLSLAYKLEKGGTVSLAFRRLQNPPTCVSLTHTVLPPIKPYVIFTLLVLDTLNLTCNQRFQTVLVGSFHWLTCLSSKVTGVFLQRLKCQTIFWPPSLTSMDYWSRIIV